MIVTPAGILSDPLYLMANLLAQSANFQAWTGAANAAAALALVHIIEPDDGAVAHPLAVVNWKNIRWNAIASGTAFQFASSGLIEVLLESPVDPSQIDLSADPAYAFTNAVGGIVADLLALAGQSGQLYMTGLSIDEPPSRVPEGYLGDVGDYFQIRLTAQWGVQ